MICTALKPVATPATQRLSSLALEGASSEPSDTVRLSHPLSADFETHKANLQAATRGPKLAGFNWDWLTGGKKPSFHETPSNRDVNQTKFEADLLKDLGSQVRIQNQQDVSKLDGRLPTTTELNAEFKKLAADKTIPFEYIIDGCYARAHLMCDTMHKDGINSAKIFTMVENPQGDDMLKASNKFMNATWWYHVAPLSFAKDPETNEVKGFVMDPSMADHPLQPKEWVRAMWDAQSNIKIDVTRSPQYGPLEEDGENKTFAESMPDAHRTAAQYSVELAGIKSDYYAHHPEEKPTA